MLDGISREGLFRRILSELTATLVGSDPAVKVDEGDDAMHIVELSLDNPTSHRLIFSIECKRSLPASTKSLNFDLYRTENRYENRSLERGNL